MDTLQVIAANIPKSSTIEEIIRILSAALTPVIAIAVAYIAWKQYQLQKQRWRLDLYDKRYKVYDTLSKLIYSIQMTTEDNVEEHYKIFAHATEIILDGEFLFDKDIRDLNGNLFEQMSHMFDICFDMENDPQGSQEYKRKLHIAYELSNSITDRLPEVKKAYAEYLEIINH